MKRSRRTESSARPVSRHLRRGVLGLLAIWSGTTAATALHAQVLAPGVRVTPLRDLDFGEVLAGIGARVSPGEARAGEFEVRGAPGARVRVTFHLPARMHVGGRALTLDFGPDDGLFAAAGLAAGALPIDPRDPFVMRLGPDGRGFLWLGGTAAADRLSSGPAEPALITVTVEYAEETGT